MSSDSIGALHGPDWHVDIPAGPALVAGCPAGVCAETLAEHRRLGLACTNTYLVAEIRARDDYRALPWRARIITEPPPGLAGAWTTRVVSRCAALVRKRAEEGP